MPDRLGCLERDPPRTARVVERALVAARRPHDLDARLVLGHAFHRALVGRLGRFAGAGCYRPRRGRTRFNTSAATATRTTPPINASGVRPVIRYAPRVISNAVAAAGG